MRLPTPLLALLAIPILLVAASAVGWIVLQQHLGSEAFRLTVQRHANALLEVDGTVGPHRWSGTQLYVESYRGQGQPTSPVAQIELQQLHLTLSLRGIFSGVWQLKQPEIARASILLRDPRAPVERIGSAERQRPEEATAEALPAWLSWLPRQVQSEPLQIAHASLSAPHLLGGLVVDESRVVVDAQPNGASVTAQGGKVTFGREPAWTLERLRLSLKPEVLYLNEARLTRSPQVVVRVDGEVPLEAREGAAGKGRLNLALDQLPLAQLVPGDWRAHFLGNCHAQLVMQLDTAEEAKPAWTVEGPVEVRDCILELLPVLQQLAQFTGVEELRRLRLQEVRGQASFSEGGAWRLERLAIESNNLLRVEGALRGQLESGEGLNRGGSSTLEGVVQFGVKPQLLKNIPAAQQRVFTVERGGYLWTPVTLGGTLAQPTEDLSQRLAQAAVEGVVEQIKRQVPAEAQETIQRGVDFLRGILPVR